MKIDLHNHSNYSDGIYTPKEVLDRAIKNNISVMALTDHDSVFGCEEIYEYSKDKPIKVIKGMELSTNYKNESIHIICLFKNNIIPQEMIEFSKQVVETRINRAIKMMENIRDIYGLKVDIDELINESTIITRANMLRNIMKHNNLEEKDASFYVSSKSKAYIKSTKMTVEDGLKLARKANCLAIFAHPCLVENQDYVREILNLGFDGIEVRYPSPKNDVEKFTNLAKEYNILISAGSDFHGDFNPDHGDIGTATLSYEEFLPILKKLELEELI